MSDEAILLNLSEIAKTLKVSQPTVRAWIDKGCPVVEGGSNGVPYKFDLKAVIGWRQGEEDREDAARKAKSDATQQLVLSLLGSDTLPDVGGASGLNPEQRKKVYDAELARMRIGRERGELLLADDLQISLSRVMAALSQRLRSLPDSAASEIGLDDGQVRQLQTLVEDALNDTADEIQALMAETSETDDGESGDTV